MVGARERRLLFMCRFFGFVVLFVSVQLFCLCVYFVCVFLFCLCVCFVCTCMSVPPKYCVIILSLLILHAFNCSSMFDLFYRWNVLANAHTPIPLHIPTPHMHTAIRTVTPNISMHPCTENHTCAFMHPHIHTPLNTSNHVINHNPTSMHDILHI